MDFSSLLYETFALFECHFLTLILTCSCWGVVYLLGKFNVNTDLVLGQFTPLWPLAWRILTCLVICIALHILCLSLPGVIAAAIAPTLPLIIFPLLVVYVLDHRGMSANCLLMIRDMLMMVSFRATFLADLLTSVPRVFSSFTCSWMIITGGVLGLRRKAEVLHECWEVCFFNPISSVPSSLCNGWEMGGGVHAGCCNESLYSFAWDILFDWDMIGRMKNVQLFPNNDTHMAVRVIFYIWFILSDLIMRYAWYLKKLSGKHSLIAFGYALLELYRRFQWMFLRIEVEAAQQGPDGENLEDPLLC
ncbi:uncharacterized protein LOC113279531 [Papaver somniferum]|uniref:uncharacterized protein LOC113279531 n=1 Tax=Papaver somniferum TaxID=3469 RepID=UPI000E6F4DC0|nr:uncharacterized protein LOC113279531 [Papaver somniferum]